MSSPASTSLAVSEDINYGGFFLNIWTGILNDYTYLTESVRNFAQNYLSDSVQSAKSFKIPVQILSYYINQEFRLYKNPIYVRI
jgi:hypothetical protein